MQYGSFELYGALGLEPRLALDPGAIQRKFYEQSRQWHPDRFTRGTPAEQQHALDMTALVNDSYRTLRDPVARAEYFLKQNGLELSKDAPPELLEEVFELNESLDELREARQSGGSSGEMAGLEAKLEAAQHRFESSLADVDRELARISSEWDEALNASYSPGTNSGGGDAARKKLMERMNEILNRRSYIRNLVNSVRQELAGT
jgi:molecular chaperone HscB